MPAPLGDLRAEAFLRDFWQKRPCLIRRAFPDFAPELDGHDLAGLACDPLAEARIVTGGYPASDWQVRHGPFSERDFARLPETHWTLLVQDVEKHYPPLADLMQSFDFLPAWRLDDLMASWSAVGGSVGPHVDQYDVFLLQAEGRRRWQIAERFDPERLTDCPLDVLRFFEPEQEWELGPGDLLYLPPGVAHFGVAITPGMTWSIGLRAPDAADLLTALGERLAVTGGEALRYRDPDLRGGARPGEIDAAALGRLRELMLAPLADEDAFRAFAGAFLTRFRLAHEPAPPDAESTGEEVAALLRGGARLVRNPWTRLAWVKVADGARLFAAGEEYPCSAGLAEAICARAEPHFDRSSLEPRDLETLTGLIHAGHLLLDGGA